MAQPGLLWEHRHFDTFALIKEFLSILFIMLDSLLLVLLGLGLVTVKLMNRTPNCVELRSVLLGHGVKHIVRLL